MAADGRHDRLNPDRKRTMTSDTPLSCPFTLPAQAPKADARPQAFTIHGRRIADDYAWLKAENWRDVLKDPATLPADIRAYLEAENAYAEAALGQAGALRKTLVAEMRARIREDDASVPDPDGPFAYYMRHREGGQHP